MLTLSAVVVLLVVVNLLNNWLAPRAYLLTCAVSTALLAGLGCSYLGLAPDTAARGAEVGLAGIAAVAAAYTIVALLPATRRVFADRRVEDAGWGDAVYQVAVRIPFGTVALEEVAFRGVLYGLVLAQHGPLWATVVSSVLFGLWHVLPALPMTRLNAGAGRAFGNRPAVAVAVAVLATAAAGVVLCELRRRTGSLLAPMAVHWATNGLGYLAALIVVCWARLRRGRGRNAAAGGRDLDGVR